MRVCARVCEQNCVRGDVYASMCVRERVRVRTSVSIRNYEDTGRSSFRFHREDFGDLLHTCVIPHIRDFEDQQYYSGSTWLPPGRRI